MVIEDSQKKQDKNAQSAPVQEIPPTSTSAKGQSPKTKLNAGTSDPTDGRKPYEWVTGYPHQAWVEIVIEAIFLVILLICSLLLIFLTWKGWICSQLSVSPEQTLTLKKYAYYVASGMLGGATFDIKYLYRSVARGYWHQDRRLWRLMSPFIAMTVALIVGTMIEASLITRQVSVSGAAFVSIGFLAGYFADNAVAKMYEVATVIFGKSAAMKDGNDK